MTVTGSGLLGPAAAARQVSASRPIRLAAHAGLAARGILDLILGVLAFDVALHGSSPAPTDAQGALQEVARQSAGPVLLVAVAVGLGAYALWRLMQVVSGRGSGPRDTGVLRRLGWLGIAVVYGGLCAEAVQLAGGSSSTSSSSRSAASNPEPWAAHVLRWPGGPELLGFVGAGLVVAGGALALWGVLHDHDKELRLDGLSRLARRTVLVLGGAGNAARGVSHRRRRGVSPRRRRRLGRRSGEEPRRRPQVAGAAGLRGDPHRRGGRRASLFRLVLVLRGAAPSPLGGAGEVRPEAPGAGGSRRGLRSRRPGRRTSPCGCRLGRRDSALGGGGPPSPPCEPGPSCRGGRR